MGSWGNGELGKWGVGEMGSWGNGELGKWGVGEENGELGKWGVGEETTTVRALKTWKYIYIYNLLFVLRRDSTLPNFFDGKPLPPCA